MSSASDPAKLPVRHGTTSLISLGLTCKAVITFFGCLNYQFFGWVSTGPQCIIRLLSCHCAVNNCVY